MTTSTPVQRIALAAFSSLVLGTGSALAATPTATDPSQEPAATPMQAEQPRLPNAKDTHRDGPTQTPQGSGAVTDVPETLRSAPSRDELGATSADRMEAGRDTKANGTAGSTAR